MVASRGMVRGGVVSGKWREKMLKRRTRAVEFVRWCRDVPYESPRSGPVVSRVVVSMAEARELDEKSWRIWVA